MKKSFLLPLLTVIMALLVWQGYSYYLNSLLLPSPIAMGKAFFWMWDQQLILDLSFTLLRTFLGLSLAILLGVPLGLVMGYFPKAYHSLEFLIDFGRSIPPVTLFPVFLLTLGIGEASKIFPIAVAGSFYVLMNTLYGVRNVKKLRLDWAKTIPLSQLDVIKKIILPEVMPYLLTGIRIAITVSLILVLTFEMFVGTNYGLGQRIVDAQLMYEIPLMYALIALTGIMGYSINQLFLSYERKKTHWWGK